jgi:hypothetical protein
MAFTSKVRAACRLTGEAAPCGVGGGAVAPKPPLNRSGAVGECALQVAITAAKNYATFLVTLAIFCLSND